MGRSSPYICASHKQITFQCLRFSKSYGLSQFYLTLSTTNNLIPKVFGCVSFVHIHNHGKLDPRAIKCVFVGYSSTQKGYKCYHPSSKKFYIYIDVTFNENESYFTSPYLQGNKSTMEDKDKDFFLIDLSLSTQPVSSIHSSHESIPSHNCEKQSTNNDVYVLDNMRFGKVYSRNKSLVPALERVQDSDLKTGNEVTISNSCTELEPLAKNKLDHDLPIAVRKKTK